MGLNLSVNILTSGILVTVVMFLVLMGILFYIACLKMGEILLSDNSFKDNLLVVNNALNACKIAFILAFVGAGASLLLAILYASHELLFTLSEYFHLILYLAVYALLIVSVVYAGIALYRIYNVSVSVRNGADAFLWAGLLMAVFAFVGLTGAGSGRLGMNVVRNNAKMRLERVEDTIHTYLPAIHNDTEHIPIIHSKVHNVHESIVSPISYSQPSMQTQPIMQTQPSMQTQPISYSQPIMHLQPSMQTQPSIPTITGFGGQIASSSMFNSQSTFNPSSTSIISSPLRSLPFTNMVNDVSMLEMPMNTMPMYNQTMYNQTMLTQRRIISETPNMLPNFVDTDCIEEYQI